MKNTFKDNFLKGKSAVVTGGATGICYNIAESFLKYGASVMIVSRKAKNIESAVIALKASTKSDNIWG